MISPAEPHTATFASRPPHGITFTPDEARALRELLRWVRHIRCEGTSLRLDGMDVDRFDFLVDVLPPIVEKVEGATAWPEKTPK